MATSDDTDIGANGSAPGSVASQAIGQTPGEPGAAAAHPSDPPTSGQHSNQGLRKLTLGSVGVVYGHIGTSPIYAMRESLHAASSDGLSRADVMASSLSSSGR